MNFAEQIEILFSLKTLEQIELLETQEKKDKSKRAFWVNPFLAKRQLDCSKNASFKNFTRLTYEQFSEILTLVIVEHQIQKKDTTFRTAISARVRLAITFRYIATGDSFYSLEYLTRVSRKTVSKFIPEVLAALYSTLQPKYLKVNMV